MTTPRALRALPALPALLLASLLAGAGCAGPDYAGGPGAEDPHGEVVAADDIHLWRVDGKVVSSRSAVRVAPGSHVVQVRIEYPISSESAEPHELRDVPITVEEGRVYYVVRVRDELEMPPYELEVRVSPR